MQRERDELRALVQTQRQTIQTQERELRRLRAALRAVTAEPTAQSIKTEDEDVPMDGGGPAPVPAPPNGAEIEEEAEDDEDEDIEPVWGEDDAMYFCGICGWEIAEALCQNCCQQYDGYDVHLDPHGNPLPNSDNIFAERDEAYRLTTARGTTPLLDVDSGRLRPDTVAYGYEGRVNEYRALLSRGATRLMCETFYLSFSQEMGIVLGMADDLFDDWAGEELEDAISWKVYLGREIHLEDGDDDGSEYIDAVLEDALLFGGHTESYVFWETVQTEPRHWVTRPTAEIDAPESPSCLCYDEDVELTCPVDGHLNLSGRPGTLAHDDFLWDNSADEDEECDSADDEDGQVQLGWDGEGGWGPNGPRESDNEDAMDEDTTAADGENAGDDEDDEEEDYDEDEDEDETIISEPDSFDSDFDSDEELSGDEPILAGNQEYFKSSYVPRSGPDPTHYL